jgi:uncharacterized membrane protein
MDDQEKQALAERRVHQLEGFYIHLTVFALVMALLAAINIANGAPYWVVWPFLGWGIGILGHAMTAFGRSPRLVANWRAREIERIKRSL